MSEFKWEKCYVEFISHGGVILRKGKHHLGDMLIKVRMGFLSKPVTFAIVPDSHGYPFKKRILWLIGKNKVALPLVKDRGLPLTEKDMEEMESMLRVVGRDKWFKAMAGKNLTWFEELIRLVAGFGLFTVIIEVLKVVFQV